MRVRIFAVIVALIAAATIRALAHEIVEIRVNGYYFAEPATVRITVAVEPDAANRSLRIEADGDRMYRSTEVDLEGVTDKRIHTFEFKNLPAGAYELRAEVFSKDKVRGVATSDLVVEGGTGR